MFTLKDLYGKSHAMDTQFGMHLYKATAAAGGWRGLFDCSSSEWSHSELPDKCKLLDRWKQFLGCDFGYLVYMWVLDCKESTSSLYQLDSLPMTLFAYHEAYQPCKQYLSKCTELHIHQLGWFLKLRTDKPATEASIPFNWCTADLEALKPELFDRVLYRRSEHAVA